ncbi:nucleoside recognition domain-containing protein [Balneolaceae bacterium ANBcel3]|nr:nucleoside recognition domain-containing protein [Balneolaceae bacterium ANBcel3]
MLNYIWAGLIIISLAFAVIHDITDITRNTYRNGEIHTLDIRFPKNSQTDQRQPVYLYKSDDDTGFEASWRPVNGQYELAIPVSEKLPELWLQIAEDQEAADRDVLLAVVTSFDSEASTVSLLLPEVRYVKLRAITAAAFSMAEFAVTLAIGLIGVMALWLGLMKIAEKSGLVYILVKGVQPFLGFLFPNVPKDHAAHGIISLNMAANMLGLGNAATPLGIKAMEELQKLNPSKDKASNAQCMLLTVNTASVQLLPPATLVALMGTGVNKLVISMALATLVSLIVGITAAKIYERFHPEEPHLANIANENKGEG